MADAGGSAPRYNCASPPATSRPAKAADLADLDALDLIDLSADKDYGIGGWSLLQTAIRFLHFVVGVS